MEFRTAALVTKQARLILPPGEEAPVGVSVFWDAPVGSGWFGHGCDGDFFLEMVMGVDGGYGVRRWCPWGLWMRLWFPTSRDWVFDGWGVVDRGWASGGVGLWQSNHGLRVEFWISVGVILDPKRVARIEVGWTSKGHGVSVVVE